jgi:hypothetical protein
MTTLLRNSLLATSTDITSDSSSTNDISKVIPPKPLIASPNTPSTTPLVTIQKSSSGSSAPSPATLGDFKKLYNQLQTDSGREQIGNDPLLQKNAIEKINQFLTRYPETKANPNFNEDLTKPWTDLPVKTLYVKTIQTLIDLINDISDIISASEIDGSVVTRRKIVEAFFRKERRVYVGLLFIFLSFVLYFIDSAV